MIQTNIKLKDIKLIIFDLDDTIWDGIISEQDVVLSDANKKMCKDLVDRGIMISICSKNDFNVIKNFLIQNEVWEYFVFPSINWEPKGERLKQIIKKMQLRDANVLFIDDNINNLQQAKYYCEGLMICLPDVIEEITKQIAAVQPIDPDHKRLEQYRVLEEKNIESEKFNSDSDFLRSCNIKVNICSDCDVEIDRLVDLLLRSNQLNFTKIRSNKEELNNIITDPAFNCGFVSVTDKFGDYGIVGFYAINKETNEALHFVFSCRTLGMGVEQYVYAQLNYPFINVVGEVVVTLDQTMPDYINQNELACKNDNRFDLRHGRMLFKGPCDVEQLLTFLKGKSDVSSEFTYISKTKKISVEEHNHTFMIIGSFLYSQDTKKEILNNMPFYDEDIFNTSIFSEKYEVVVLSLLTDYGLGVYKKKNSETDIFICYAQYKLPLTDEKYWDDYINGRVYTGGVVFTLDFLKWFSENYEFIGPVTGDMLYQNLCFIREHLQPETLLVLLNGAELPYLKNDKPEYNDRQIHHINMNQAALRFCEKYKKTTMIDINRFAKSQEDFTNNINHFRKEIYYNIALELIQKVKEQQVEINAKSRAYCLLLELVSPFYAVAAKTYRKIEKTVYKLRKTQK